VFDNIISDINIGQDDCFVIGGKVHASGVFLTGCLDFKTSATGVTGLLVDVACSLDGAYLLGDVSHSSLKLTNNFWLKIVCCSGVVPFCLSEEAFMSQLSHLNKT
jgi:hypothetical protein